MPIITTRGALSARGTGLFNQAVIPRYVGGMYSTGNNVEGQLGLGDNTDRNAYTQIGTDTNWVQVSGGGSYNLSPASGFAVALKSNGTIYATGNNQFYQLGLGNTTSYNTFQQIGTDTNWAYIAASDYGSVLAVKTNGTLWGWGYYAPLGLGSSTTYYTTPQQIGTDTDWAIVSCAGGHGVALKTNGTLWTAGANASGQLSDGTTTNRFSWAQVGSDTDWVRIQAPPSKTIAQKSNGYLYTCGSNLYGELALGIPGGTPSGTTVYTTTLTSVVGNTNWADWYMDQTCLIALDSGYNNYSAGTINKQGIDPSGTTYYDTLTATGVSNIYRKIYAGCSTVFTLYQKYDNTIWVIGANAEGETGTNQTIPNNYTTSGIVQVTPVNGKIASYGSSVSDRFNFVIIPA